LAPAFRAHGKRPSRGPARGAPSEAPAGGAVRKFAQKIRPRKIAVRMSSLPPKYDNPVDLSDDHTFLEAQTGRLLGSVPDRNLTPAHRKGLWMLLRTVYPQCYIAQVIGGVHPARARRMARCYFRALQPPSFRVFSTVTARAAKTAPPARPLARSFYRSSLPIVQEAFRQVRELDLEKGGDSAQQATIQLAERLTERLKDRFPELADSWPRLVTTDLFLNDRGDMARPYETARLLAARLAGFRSKSLVQLERDFKTPVHAAWRIPEWESPEAAALAQKLLQLPS